MNKISIIWEVLRCIFEVLVILLDFPAFIWYGWLDVLENDGHCGAQDDGTFDTYGIYMQLALGILFYLSLSIVYELYFLPARIYEHCYEKSKGFTTASNCQFFFFQVICYVRKLAVELPILLLTALLLTETKKWFFVAVLGATIVVNLCLIYLFPKICLRCE